MTNTTNITDFLELLKAGLWEKPDVNLPKYISPLGWSEILHLAEEQSVVGLIAAGLGHYEGDISQTTKLQIVAEALQIEQRNKAMNLFIAGLVKDMRKAGIYTLLIKGQGIARYYERPLWRASGDVDLYLSEDNYKKAKLTLCPLAQSIEEEYAYTKHQAMMIAGWEVEIHGNLRSGLLQRIDRQLDKINEDVFYGGNVRLWMNGDTQVFVLDACNEAIYVFTHILQHYFKWGIGLRQICDWCRMLWSNREIIDEKKIEKKLRAMGLMTEWRAFASVAVDLLGMPQESMPLYSKEEKWKRKAKRVMGIVFKSGNMGHNRDMSYFQKYPFVIRKAISLWKHTKESLAHFMVFPVDSFLIWGRILTNGVKVAVWGDKA